MATKSLVSATATLGIERRGGGGQGREDPGIPGCHPRSRPRVPRLLPPPLAAASARETRRSGADERGEERGDPRPPPTPRAARSASASASHQPGGAREAPSGQEAFPRTPPSLRTWKFLEIGAGADPRNPPRHPRRPPPTPRPGYEDSLAGLRGRPTRLGRTGAAGGAHSATRSPAARPRENGDRAGPRRGGETRSGEGPVKLGPSAPRVSAHGRAALLPPPPPALRPSPPPAARRALHYPARRPTELCRYHFRRERRARRRTPARCSGERKCGEAEPAGRRGRCPRMERLCGRGRGARGSSRALGIRCARLLNAAIPLCGHTSPSWDRDIGTDTVMAVSPSRRGILYTALEVSPVPRPSQSPRTTR